MALPDLWSFSRATSGRAELAVYDEIEIQVIEDVDTGVPSVTAGEPDDESGAQTI